MRIQPFLTIFNMFTEKSPTSKQRVGGRGSLQIIKINKKCRYSLLEDNGIFRLFLDDSSYILLKVERNCSKEEERIIYHKIK